LTRRKVTIAPDAIVAFAKAKTWLCQPVSGATGKKRWAALNEARLSLEHHPHLGGESRDHPEHRQLVVSGYRLVYQVASDTGDAMTAGDVVIVALFGPGQR
jgi:hypothetical protein